MNYTEFIRLTEIDLIIDEIRGEAGVGSSVLEIGGGAGWQAKKLYENGFAVESIDIPQSIYSGMKVWAITDYDGKHIPFPNEHFDIIFSSNALEHVPHLLEFQNEMKRVLKANGLALHIVPSGTWRFWTNVAHYLFMIKFLSKVAWDKITSSSYSTNRNEMEVLAMMRLERMSTLEAIKKGIIPPRHGEKGSALSEIYYFSRRNWLSLFKESGWRVEKVFSNKLIYTGHMIVGPLLPMSCRRKLSYVLGGSCHIFKLRKVITGFQPVD